MCALCGGKDAWRIHGPVSTSLAEIETRLNGPTLRGDEDAEVTLGRYESWREIERALAAEERKSKVYDRLERQVRGYGENRR